ncbi:glycosyltransferase family 17 protein [Flagelloscypha sp. PMI_526]|nr:glycosyltransferase family 17 protein [Flagelloscypha sp. PMI_526]
MANILMSRRQRFQLLLIPTALVIIFFLYEVAQNSQTIQDTISYATRPLWDTADGPQTILPHYYAEGMEFDKNACELHGWKAREDRGDVKVIDAVLVSSELDLLELRINELNSVVDRFFILESNATFTGLRNLFISPNPVNASRSFRNKIEYYYLPAPPLQDGESAWQREAKTRDLMTKSIRSHIHEFTPSTKPMVIMSDVDEIPSWHTIELLKACDFGDSIHLQMKNYLYSFEWFLGMTSWRAACGYVDKVFFLSTLANDRGVYSQDDRILSFRSPQRQADLLSPKRIQDVICKGKGYIRYATGSYGSLLSQLNPEPQKSAVNIPWWTLANPSFYKYLLPGGCIREPVTTTSVASEETRCDMTMAVLSARSLSTHS